MATERTLDDIDLQILDLLQTNAREAQVDIAKAVGLASSAVQERIRKLEARGTLRGYTAQVDPKVLGLGLSFGASALFRCRAARASRFGSTVAGRCTDCCHARTI